MFNAILKFFQRKPATVASVLNFDAVLNSLCAVVEQQSDAEIAHAEQARVSQRNAAIAADERLRASRLIGKLKSILEA